MKDISFINIETEHKGKLMIAKMLCFEVSLSYQQKTHTIYFFIDTGSSGSMLFPYSINLAQVDLQFPKEEEYQKIYIHKFGNVSIEKEFKIRIDFNAQLVQASDKPIPCGIIGNDILKNYALNINYSKKTFQLYGQNEKEYRYSCMFHFYKNFIFLYAKVNKVELKFIYDTGYDTNGKFSFFERGFNKINSGKYKSDEKETTPGAFGIVYEIDLYPQKIKLHFSDELIYESDFAVMKDNKMTDLVDCDGIIGNDLFLNRELSINYLSQKISFSEIK